MSSGAPALPLPTPTVGPRPQWLAWEPSRPPLRRWAQGPAWTRRSRSCSGTLAPEATARVRTGGGGAGCLAVSETQEDGREAGGRGWGPGAHQSGEAVRVPHAASTTLQSYGHARLCFGFRRRSFCGLRLNELQATEQGTHCPVCDTAPCGRETATEVCPSCGEGPAPLTTPGLCSRAGARPPCTAVARATPGTRLGSHPAIRAEGPTAHTAPAVFL